MDIKKLLLLSILLSFSLLPLCLKAEEPTKADLKIGKEEGEIHYQMAVQLIEEGEGEPDIASGLKLLESSAVSGYAPALEMLGVLYYKGEVVEADIYKAAEYFEEAAYKGLPSSMAMSGLIKLEGLDGDMDLVKAYFWLAVASIYDETFEKYADDLFEYLDEDEAAEAFTAVMNWVLQDH